MALVLVVGAGRMGETCVVVVEVLNSWLVLCIDGLVGLELLVWSCYACEEVCVSDFEGFRRQARDCVHIRRVSSR